MSWQRRRAGGAAAFASSVHRMAARHLARSQLDAPANGRGAGAIDGNGCFAFLPCEAGKVRAHAAGLDPQRTDEETNAAAMGTIDFDTNAQGAVDAVGNRH